MALTVGSVAGASAFATSAKTAGMATTTSTSTSNLAAMRPFAASNK